MSGLYPFRGDEPVAFESTLERDFLIRIETDPRVLTVTSQPVTIEYLNGNGRSCRYTPDYLVIYRAGPPLWGQMRPPKMIEVKPKAELRKRLAEWKPKFRAAMRYCKERDYVFHLVDETRIRDQRWENAMFLQRYRKMRFEPEVSEWIVGNLKKMGTATFDGLLARHFFGENSRAVGISHIWHLVAAGRIVCDLSLPISEFTELWIPDNEW